MKRLLLVAICCMVPVAAFPHPGKTDRHGGHKCVKACEEWGLYFNEYHLHDKYGKAVRIRSEMDKVRPAEVRSAAAETAPVVSTQTVTVYQTVTTVQEGEAVSANPLVWAILVLLLLILILRRTRRETPRS